MQNELSCNQVTALMSFYIEDKINQKLKKHIDQHLKKCPKCRELYMQSKKIANHILTLGNDNDVTPYKTKQYDDFKSNLSAYIDNELDEKESLRIKKISISNPLARKDLENAYAFKKLLHESFEKTKNELKNDYSKSIISNFEHAKDEKQDADFAKIIHYFIAIIALLIVGLLAVLNS